MEIQGKIVILYPEVSGVSRSGNEWRKREFVLETPGMYPKKVCITLFGDRSDVLNSFEEGQEVTVQVDIESREHNGRWYTSVNAYRIDHGYQTSTAAGNSATYMGDVPQAQRKGAPSFSEQPTTDASNQFSEQRGGGDDLPF